METKTNNTTPHRSVISWSLTAAMLCLGFLFAGASFADDRDLLGTSAGDPYVMILFDTSGSMNWTPQCTQEDFDAGVCQFLCPNGDCHAPMVSSDPASKMYQGKEAIYETVIDIGTVQFGFATYNQDDMIATRKHWMYFATEDGVSIPGYGSYPAYRDWDVFGWHWNCTTGRNNGCQTGDPADLNDTWETERMHFLSKGGDNFNSPRSYYIRGGSGNFTYLVTYTPVSGSYGGDLEVLVRVLGIDTVFDSSATVTYSLDIVESGEIVEDGDAFLVWDWDDNSTAPRSGYFGLFFTGASNTCSGWDPNDDSAADLRTDVNLRYPTVSDPRGDLLGLGDVIPLDWETKNRNELKWRMAPNMRPDQGGTVPDFGVASYMGDFNGNNELDWSDPTVRTILPNGSTPLEAILRDFSSWYSGCSDGDCSDGDTGWADLATTDDPDWICRQKYIILITDGDETCSGTPEDATLDLHDNLGVNTYVIGFGLNDNDTLAAMAANGGTGAPFYPSNKDELVETLKEILGSLQEETRAFSQSAAPSGQSELAAYKFLTAFTPINGNSVWAGNITAYPNVSDLDADGDGIPDASRELWNAREAVLAQAESGTRRVLYGQEGSDGVVPVISPTFESPTTCEAEQDLWDSMGYNYVKTPSCTSATEDTIRARADKVIVDALSIKCETPDSEDCSTEEKYILGDIFHSSQAVVDAPANFRYYVADLKGEGTECADGDKGYRCFADKHVYRRKVMISGSNDGQIHFFDVGRCLDNGDENPPCEFNAGTGQELMAYVPRLTLPIVKALSDDALHVYGVDGSIRVEDVFIDPSHNGTDMDDDDRNWRSVAIAGMREGGWVYRGDKVELENNQPLLSGYVAMDVTLPDAYAADGTPSNTNVAPECFSNCTEASGQNVPFGTVLWEFTDTIDGVSLDEDANTKIDLGDTWSQPTVGRIKIEVDGNIEDRFVAIFGGGFDRDSRSSPDRGNWIYMIDTETAQVLYKHQVSGAVPANPAGVDTNSDGFIDRVYFGTTAGLMYKIDMLTVPELEETTVTLLNTDTVTVDRIIDSAWDPFPVFDTGGREIFYAPAAVFVPELNQYALAFGTGDRDLMWQLDGTVGRFYVVVDEEYTLANFDDGDIPTFESDYEQITSTDVDEGLNYLVDEPAGSLGRGWFLALEANEKVVAQSFAIGGLNIFPTFQPRVDLDEDEDGNTLCDRTGNSRVFTTYITNANAILPDPDISGSLTRDLTFADSFVSSPTAERGSAGGDEDGPGNIDDAWRGAVIAALKKFQPEGTRFGNFFIEVSFRDDRGRLIGPIPVPIGMLERNWREF